MSMPRIKTSRWILLQNYFATGFGYIAIDYMGQRVFKKDANINQNLKSHGLSQDTTINTHSLMRNFVFGFVFTNFNQVWHMKLNNFLVRTNRKTNLKMIFSPFAFIPYYVFSGIYDMKYANNIVDQVLSDALTLMLIRVPIDYLRINSYFQNASPAKPPLKQMVFVHLSTKFLIAFITVNMYAGRINGLKSL